MHQQITKKPSKIDSKSSQNRSWRPKNWVPKGSWGDSLQKFRKMSENEAILVPSWGHVGTQNFTFFRKIRSKRLSGSLRRRFLRVQKNCLKLESSWHRFLKDFGRVLDRFWRSKMWSKCRTIIKFWGLGHFKIKWVLEAQKTGFWEGFGGPSWRGKSHMLAPRGSWAGSWRDFKCFFGVSQKYLKNK